MEAGVLRVSDMIDIVGVLREVKETMNMNELLVFLTVASMPEASINDISKSTGIPQNSVSRHILKLSVGHNSVVNEGTGLVERIQDEGNHLVTRACLSEKGKKLLNEILSPRS